MSSIQPLRVTIGGNTMKKLKVIQWTTGKVGKLALRGILDDPRLQLVGVYAYSEDKAGVDAGELCGRPACGVKASNRIDELLALGADTVIYTPFMADVEHVSRLLESGLDVISTNLFLNVGGLRGEVRETLAAACERGGSSLFISGINPGWVNSTTAALTAVCRRVDSVSIAESADVSVYESAETWQAMGMGSPDAAPEVEAMAKEWMVSFRDAVERMAEALAYELDDTEFFIEFGKAAEKVDLGWFAMEQDTIAAVRAGWNGVSAGRTVVQIKVTWYLTRQLREDWELDDDHYHIVIKGEPEVNTRIRFIPPEHWGNADWDTMTAMPAVNAVADVKAAKAGILSLRDVGLVCAPAGVWADG